MYIGIGFVFSASESQKSSYYSVIKELTSNQALLKLALFFQIGFNPPHYLVLRSPMGEFIPEGDGLPKLTY